MRQNYRTRKLCLLLATICCMNTVQAKTGTENIKATYRNIKIQYNNKLNELAIEPFIINGSVYVPLRGISQIMGANVEWLPSTNVVKIDKKETTSDNTALLNEIASLQQELNQTKSQLDQVTKELEQYKHESDDNTPPTIDDDTAIDDKYSFEEKVLQLVNKERINAGLKRLTLDPNLRRIARIKSNDMYEKNYFDHTSPTYGSPFEMLDYFGYKYKRASENIAKGQRSPEQVMESWMNSPGHRQNILDPYVTKIGIGFNSDSYIWTQLFSD